MQVTLLQIDIAWRDAGQNRSVIENMMSGAAKSDLYVLPEMFTTGFDVTPRASVEVSEGETLQWMRKMAARYDAAVAGSVAIQSEDGNLRNRLYFVKPDGTYQYYDKRHLFTYGGEDKAYTCGANRVIVEWRNVRFLLQICYDLRFPVFARNGINKTNASLSQYDCCIYVANWPSSRRSVWNTLLHARALENQCYILGVNRVGDDDVCHYDGGTVVIDAYGKDVAVAPDNTVAIVTAELDMDRLSSFRKKFPVLYDTDHYTINN